MSLDYNEMEPTTWFDIAGIENITKFKYRKNLPKYPKPGTFYWVEEIVNGKPKFGIWFTTNDDVLRRLDSKMYELVVRDKDGYIQITDPDELDRQEIYLIIGKFIKEDYTIKINENDKGTRIFRVTSPDNRGLATVEAVVEYVSDSNNMLYQSTVEDFYKVGIRLGDIRINDNKYTLKNNTISEILDTIIYPTLEPEVTQPSVNINIQEDGKDFNDDYNVVNAFDLIDGGDELNFIKNAINKIQNDPTSAYNDWVTCERGHLTYPTDESVEIDESDKYTHYNYAGDYENTISSVIKLPEYDDVNIDKVYEFQVGVKFSDGPTPLDNKRRRAIKPYDDIKDMCTCAQEDGCEECQIPQFKEGIAESNIQKFSVVYPIFANGDVRVVTGEDTDLVGIKHFIQWPELIDYNKKEGDEIIIHCPGEQDGESVIPDSSNTLNYQPVKFCIGIPNFIRFTIYQYNELTEKFDVDITDNFHQVFNMFNHNTIYNVYLRTDDVYDTNVETVRYKIKLERLDNNG